MSRYEIETIGSWRELLKEARASEKGKSGGGYTEKEILQRIESLWPSVKSQVLVGKEYYVMAGLPKSGG